MWVDRYTDLLCESVETDNCLSLLELAEQLRLPRLWERSLKQVLRAMDEFSSAEDSNGNSACALPSDHFTPELKNRVSAIQSAIRSSIHLGSVCAGGAPSAPSTRLFFSSIEEYIAIFAERVQYYQERLAAAKEQRDELLMAGVGAGNHSDGPAATGDSNRGRFVVTPRGGYFAVLGGTSAQYLDDLQTKIDRQEARVRTLEIALQEHRKLLGAGSSSSTASDATSTNGLATSRSSRSSSSPRPGGSE
jgi:hypothetical protein